MARFNKRFEVKREMSDGGKIRPDDDKSFEQTGGRSSLEQQREIYEEANKTGGFDDIDIISDISEEDFEEEIYEQPVETKMPDKETTQRMLREYANMANSGEIFGNSYIGRKAKELGVDKEELRLYIREKAKAQIQSPEKVLHYHRTSLENADKILQSGYLLNRANRRKNGENLTHLAGSSSDNVQFTVDKYNNNGILISSGFDLNATNIGAASTDIVFVMSPDILKEDSYDCLAPYPTVEKANIRECCATILARNPEVLAKLQNRLSELKLDIPTMLQEEFNRNSILQDIQKGKIQQETDTKMTTANGKNISETDNKATNFQVGTHDNNIYQYTDAVQSIQSNAFDEYCEYLVANDMDMTEEGQKEFIGKAMGKKYAELFEGADEKQLAEIFGRLDYSSLYDTQMNYNEWTNTKVKSLLGLQRVQGADGSEIFVAQYEQSMEDGEPYEMVSEYYSLDEKGNLVQQEAPQIQESGKSIVMTQKSIADKLGQRNQDRVANSERTPTPSTETKERGILDRVGKGLDNLINGMDKAETKMTEGLDKLVDKAEKVAKPIFEQALLLAGFSPETITGLKSSIQMVAPRALLTMDNILGRVKDQTLSRGGIEDGNEQDYR